MAAPSYAVTYGGSDSIGWNNLLRTLTNITSVSISLGRQWQTDPYSPGSAVIECRDISSWPVIKPVIGDAISIYSGSDYVFTGFIRDVKINYGTLSAMDTATITCEGPLAQLGRAQLTGTVLSQQRIDLQIDAISTAANTAYRVTTPGNCLSIASAQTYNGNALDIINELAQTEIAHINEYYRVYTGPIFRCSALFYPRNYDQTVGFVLSDNPSSSTQLKYDATGIDFTSAAESFYSQVTIKPQGLTTQTAGTNPYSLTQDSLDYNTTQALSHAQYLLNQYNSKTSRPLAVTLNWANQAGNATRESTFNAFLSPGVSGSGMLGQLVFRGTTYNVVIEGHTIAADPSDTQITVYLSPFDNNNYLILNNAVFGKLDENKLGF